MKMKRKDLEQEEQVYSDFSLSSPSRKIRRLDAHIIKEEGDVGIPLDVDPPSPSRVPLNEERALVLYKPMPSSPPPVSITLNANLIPGFNNNQVFWPNYTNLLNSAEKKAHSSLQCHGTNGGMAVVPWVSNQHLTATEIGLSITELSEPMESKDAAAECGTMDIEVEEQSGAVECGTIDIEVEEKSGETGVLGDGLQRWQQQPCLTPHLHQNTPTTAMWSW